ncbi:MAG TPA: hypothetical protein VEO53_11380 [Candidatus Binatia bacterium]|nr:hypothetical protein [Candidatus Binatia bacterium]
MSGEARDDSHRFEGQAQTVLVKDLSNRQFLGRYAKPGCVGLCQGTSLADKLILRAERRLDASGRPGCWSHAFFFEGLRADRQHWIIESDLQVQKKHIRLGVQENRIAKYFDETLYPTLAVLDFGLSPEQVDGLVREGLELVATRARYSLRELVGTYLALRLPELRGRENLLARDRSFFCSAFVHHLFRKAGIDLAPGLDVKHTTPEDLSRTPVPHVTYLLKRGAPPGKRAKRTGRLRHPHV